MNIFSELDRDTNDRIVTARAEANRNQTGIVLITTEDLEEMLDTIEHLSDRIDSMCYEGQCI